MNTCIAGHRGVRDGVIHTGAAALLLGAALSMNSAHATAPSASAAVPAAKAENAAQADGARAAAKAEVAKAEAARADAARADAEDGDADERAQVEERLRDAEERMNRAAAEVAAIASERARQAMGSMKFVEGMGASRGPVIGVDLDSKSTGGARVRDVSPGGPAEEAGIRAGDVIVGVNGKDVKRDAPGDAARAVVQELQAFRGTLRQNPDAKLKLRALRDGQPKDFEVTPRRISSAFVFPVLPPPKVDVGPDASGGFNYRYNFFGGNSDLAGLEVTALTPQLGRYFGASKGVLVVRAPKSDTYKLQDGDVIVAIDGREPTSGSHITRILSSYQPGEQVTLRVMRDHKAQDIRVTVPDRRQSRWGSPDTWVGEPM